MLTKASYKQMVGRAGRAGFDTAGESFLLVPERDKAKVREMLAGPMDVCRSCILDEGGKFCRKVVLSIICSKMAPDIESVIEFLEMTLLGHQDVKSATDAALSSLEDLKRLNLIEFNREFVCVTLI